MAPYDSDDSFSDEDMDASTNVLLGYASKEPTDDTVSHLGGTPVSLHIIPKWGIREGR